MKTSGNILALFLLSNVWQATAFAPSHTTQIRQSTSLNNGSTVPGVTEVGQMEAPSLPIDAPQPVPEAMPQQERYTPPQYPPSMSHGMPNQGWPHGAMSQGLPAEDRSGVMSYGLHGWPHGPNANGLPEERTESMSRGGKGWAHSPYGYGSLQPENTGEMSRSGKGWAHSAYGNGSLQPEFTGETSRGRGGWPHGAYGNGKLNEPIPDINMSKGGKGWAHGAY